MKVPALLLSFLFIVISVLPCSDHAVHEDNETKVQWHTASESGHQPVDHCSPLCTCHCCHTHIVPWVTEKMVLLEKVTTHATQYTFRPTKAPVFSIWHPPNA